MGKIFRGLVLSLGMITPLFANAEEESLGMVMGLFVFILGLWLLVNVLFLLTQSKFAKTMKVQNWEKNTSPVWIWTQLIPIWSFIAIPVTLIKLNEQFKLYMSENNLNDNPMIKQYNNTWGWVWFGGSVLSLIIPFAGLIGFVGVIGFWIHIAGVKNSLIQEQQTKIHD
ncbi:MAG: hypothetical protein RBR07_07400 [Arcobacteraceae bacterium]|nr:hypothetical protein [Arcobacteraceae bacterium]